MFYGEQVQDTRQVFFSSWHKYCSHEVLSALEQQVVTVILEHPEYHALFENVSSTLDKAYLPEFGETNPFLHMGLHLAIRDQVATDRPEGIQSIFQKIASKCGEVMAAEHALMEQFAECLWQAQRYQRLPDASSYLQACQQLL